MKPILCVIATVSWLVSANAGIAQEKPNIVFIFVDDLDYHDVGAYGNEEVHTPVIDALDLTKFFTKWF
ncbi:MAG TPA: hypothetical protein VK074_01890 [Fodinibius sp.]|nr:hypothetical protein [Fodinibius sp.]